MIEPPLPTRAKKVPITDEMIEMPPIASGNSSRWRPGNVCEASSITATAVTA